MLTESVGGVRAFEPIVETLRTGKPGFDIAHGMTMFEFVERHPQQTQGFQAAMSERTAALARSVAAGYDFTPKILRQCRQVMPAGGRVLIIERLIPANPADAVPVFVSDLNMLVFTGGQERTNAEYGQLLAAAGLNLETVQPVAPPYGVIAGAQAS
jgi:hypothetical protein